MSAAVSLRLWEETPDISLSGAVSPTAREDILLPGEIRLRRAEDHQTTLSKTARRAKSTISSSTRRASDTQRLWPSGSRRATGIETRATILGHMQRGGSPHLQGPCLRVHYGSLRRRSSDRGKDQSESWATRTASTWISILTKRWPCRRRYRNTSTRSPGRFLTTTTNKNPAGRLNRSFRRPFLMEAGGTEGDDHDHKQREQPDPKDHAAERQRKTAPGGGGFRGGRS